jgi:nucleotidyltransferase/DNA polymerase involved in DNA repair
MFACVYIPDFPVEAIMRVEPELRERAVAMVEGRPPLLKVVAVNERARQLGVAAGMSQVQAQGYAPSVELRKRTPLQEQAAHAALMDCACAVSPRVHGEAPDTVLLDIDGLERLFGPPTKIAGELAHRVGELGMEANVGVAANVEAAMHAARGFSGITVIPRGREAERLASLPVEVLFDVQTPTLARPKPPSEGGAPDMLDMLDTLERWGVRTFHALALLPEIALSQRLGEAGVRLRKLARGEGSCPLVPTEAPLEFEEAVELEEAIDLLEPLEFVLNRMLEQLCGRLATRSLATHELKLRMELDPQEDICVEHSVISNQHSEESSPPRRHRGAEEIVSSAHRIIGSSGEPNHGFPRIHTDTKPESIRRGSTRIDADCYLETPTHGSGRIGADRTSGIRNRKSGNSNSPQRHRGSEEIVSSAHRIISSSGWPAVEEDPSHFELVLKFPVPMLDVKVFLKLLQLELRARPPQAPVTKIWLRAEPAHPRSTQGGLFLPEAPQPERLEVTLARIAGVVGQKSAVSNQHSAKTNPPRRHGDTEGIGASDHRLSVSSQDTHPSGAKARSSYNHPGTAEAVPFPDMASADCKSEFRNQKLEIGALPVLQTDDALRVGSAEVLDTHRPDTFRMKRFSPAQQVTKRKHPPLHRGPEGSEKPNHGFSPISTDERQLTAFGIRPAGATLALRRFRPPVAARVWMENGVPVRMDAGKEHAGEIVWASGPWCASGEWWSERQWSRDAWEVAVAGETVTVYRIYREREEWRVEGEYD